MRRVRPQNRLPWFRNLSTVDGATAYKLLLEGSDGRPPPDRTSLRKLYFHFARRNHPDVDSNNSNARMSDGSNAYALLKDSTDGERQAALDHLFSKSLEQQLNISQTAAVNTSAYPRPPWEIHYDTESPEEYQEFLRNLDGNDKIRFHRRWVDADGNHYAGIGDKRVDRASQKQRSDPTSSSQQQSSAGTAIFVIYCIILYNIFHSWR
jgi:DnaJ-class molecular chaperone